MQNAFNHPPASVYLTCVEAVRRAGGDFEALDAKEKAIWLEMTSFVATSTAGRMCSRLPPPEHCRRASDITAAQIRQEALEVLREASFCSQTRDTTGGH